MGPQQRQEGPGSMLAWQKKNTCALIVPSACRIRCKCNVPEVPIQIIPLEVPNRATDLSVADEKL